jgi:hypothetical protein
VPPPTIHRYRYTGPVAAPQPTFKVGYFLWENSMGAVGIMGQAAMVGRPKRGTTQIAHE